MKQYKKTIDGNIVIENSKYIVVIKDDMQIFNPSEELILSDGWEEYIKPEIPDIDLIRNNKIDEINMYDNSNDINTFFINDLPCWLNKSERNYILTRLNAEKINNIENTSMWINNINYILPVDIALDFIYKLEIYASKCLDTTKTHIYNINNLSNIEEINNYNITSGYPEKIYFNF